jgi:hypothetical protein
VAYTEWNDEAKKSTLLAGLLQELKNYLITVPTETMTLQAVINQCQQIDNRYRASRAAQGAIRTFSNIFNTPPLKKLGPATPPTAVAPAKTVFNTDAMDLSVARSRPRGPLTPDEKARRQALELYYYYTRKGYTASGCPQAPKGRRTPASASNI